MPKKCLDRNRVFQYPAPGSVILGSQKMATRNARVSRTPLGIEIFWWPNIPEHGKAQKLCHPNETHFWQLYLVKMPFLRKLEELLVPSGTLFPCLVTIVTKAGRKEFRLEYPHSSKSLPLTSCLGVPVGGTTGLLQAIVRSIYDALRVHPCSCMRPRRVLPLRESA